MKKKITAIALAVALLAIGIVGGTVAYFQDTKSAVNTFTFGKGVSITLSETSTASAGVSAGVRYDSDGNKQGTDAAYNDAKFEGYAFDKIVPGQKLSKVPTITVDADSTDCWLIATVTVNCKTALYDIFDGTAVDQGTWLSLVAAGGLVTGGMADSTEWVATAGVEFPYNSAITCSKISKDGQDVYIVYSENGEDVTYTFYFDSKQTANASYTLFNQVEIPGTIDNDDLANYFGSGFKITVKAYAAQAEGFTDVYNAYTTAFGA